MSIDLELSASNMEIIMEQAASEKFAPLPLINAA